MSQKFWVLGLGLKILSLFIPMQIWASNYVVTARLTRVQCANGNSVLMEPGQFLLLTEELSREAYQVQLPSKFSRRCPEGKVSSFAVYNLGSFGTVEKEAPGLSRRHEEQREEENTRYREGYFPYSSENSLGSERDANNLFKKLTKNMKKEYSKEMSPLCRKKFLGEDGLGPWGEHAKDVMSRGFFEETLERDHNSFSKYCPAYRYMNVEQKKNLFVLTMMVQYNFESSCSPTAENDRCPNGICYGIAQLHLGHESGYVKHRQFKEYCPRNASRSPLQTISCTIAMFTEDLWQGEKLVGNNDSYWEVMRTNLAHSKSEDFRRLLKKVPDCQMTSVARTKPKSTPRRSRATVPRFDSDDTGYESSDGGSNTVPIGSL